MASDVSARIMQARVAVVEFEDDEVVALADGAIGEQDAFGECAAVELGPGAAEVGADGRAGALDTVAVDAGDAGGVVEQGTAAGGIAGGGEGVGEVGFRGRARRGNGEQAGGDGAWVGAVDLLEFGEGFRGEVGNRGAELGAGRDRGCG